MSLKEMVLDHVVVSTSLGKVIGEIQTNGICHFSGLPYAAPPVGKHRWKRPRPPTPWTGRLDATRCRPSCDRTAAAHHFYDSDEEGKHGTIQSDASWEPAFHESEDCLHASVWAPLDAVMCGAPTPDAPILVYIHGRGLSMGCCTEAAHSGAAYARRGFVVVSFNYRLGPLGWYQPRGGDANCGLWDAVALLQWVQTEGRAFGGDVNCVTLMGQSAGADCVMWLSASPVANRLFHRAVLESPGSLALTSAQASDIVEEFVSVAGARSSSLEDMQALSIPEIKKACEKLSYRLSPAQPGTRFDDVYPSSTPDATLSFTKSGMLIRANSDGISEFAAVVDGELLLETPLDAFAHGVASHLDFIVGFSRFENWGPTRKLSLAHALSWELVGSPESNSGNMLELREVCHAVEAAYNAEFKSGPIRIDTSSKIGMQRAKDALFSDFAHGVVSYLLMERLAVFGNSRCIFAFEFMGTDGKNSAHGVQFPYTFGPQYKGMINRNLRDQWMDSYAAFFRSGTPDVSSFSRLGVWRPYRGRGGPMMHWDTKHGCRLSEDGLLRRVGLHALAMSYEKLWKLCPVLTERPSTLLKVSRKRKGNAENIPPRNPRGALKAKRA
eukprot:TRINITY_DN32018_c0_g1_i1.p1 TRINITY_DN32018_c0_g1~~TRINITY_DN32018_c0_g1_i1.p1  ORF type:complete len:610 (-),score=52.55 TRINITY_DN32018_c0_g1_i1:90-1919(-)